MANRLEKLDDATLTRPEFVDKLESPYPVRFLSSEGCDWSGLLLQAFHEPPELESWIEAATPNITLVLLNRGSMYLEQRLGKGEWRGFSARTGDMFLNPAGSPSAELRWRSLSEEQPQTLRLELNVHLLERIAEEITGGDGSKVVLRGRAGFQDPLIAQLGLALYRELEQPSPASKLYAQTAAQLLAVHLVQHYSSIEQPLAQNETFPTLTRRQMLQLTEFIEAHLHEELSLQCLAQQTGLSAYHFARLFRQATGESPHQYVLRLRLARARLLLKKSDLPISQVALEAGFADQSHFSRVFKSYLGSTPRAYRQEL
ncbi:MAG TPA: AraC family transcriptional regulator [Chloroflexia bacterium]|nr:AraC family transcriptional regulator [Chloroflexia bacterium]